MPLVVSGSEELLYSKEGVTQGDPCQCSCMPSALFPWLSLLPGPRLGVQMMPLPVANLRTCVCHWFDLLLQHGPFFPSSRSLYSFNQGPLLRACLGLWMSRWSAPILPRSPLYWRGSVSGSVMWGICPLWLYLSHKLLLLLLPNLCSMSGPSSNKLCLAVVSSLLSWRRHYSLIFYLLFWAMRCLLLSNTFFHCLFALVAWELPYLLRLLTLCIIPLEVLQPFLFMPIKSLLISIQVSILIWFSACGFQFPTALIKWLPVAHHSFWIWSSLPAGYQSCNKLIYSNI